MSSSNWIAPEVPMRYFKFSFRCSQWKGTHRKPRRRTRVCRCNQPKRGPCHCRESIQPQELWNISGIPGMYTALPISFLVFVFIFLCFLLLSFLATNSYSHEKLHFCFLQPRRLPHIPPVIFSYSLLVI